MSERWRAAPGLLGYEVSDMGRLRNSAGRVLTTPIGSHGYARKCLRGVGGHGKRTNVLLHRLVAQAFLPNPFDGVQVNHKNGNRLDNRADNLEWVTPSENIRHGHRIGLMRGRPGESNPIAKLTHAKVADIRRRMHAGEMAVALAKEYGVSRSAVGKIKRGEMWRHASPEPASPPDGEVGGAS